MTTTPAAYDPYRDLAERHPAWSVRVDGRMPENYLGLCDFDNRTIWLHPDQPDDQMAATMAHELVHIDLGHDGPQHEVTEEAVDVIAASRFLAPAFMDLRGLDPDMRYLWNLAVRRASRRTTVLAARKGVANCDTPAQGGAR